MFRHNNPPCKLLMLIGGIETQFGFMIYKIFYGFSCPSPDSVPFPSPPSSPPCSGLVASGCAGGSVLGGSVLGGSVLGGSVLGGSVGAGVTSFTAPHILHMV